ncbi:DUF2631 domain-containing protein [Gandjariella thermophila]|uniref:DUF2631 domain-containing protein n=1 Tax=Gandjariella thermophila TaxID=1931992 RepID=A0A4D4J667_9PSEU|nr:DUF2631 domain-containing protein [Gandjariella thermophila]GDY30592.1 hypothetical protein GTS_22250 [Gandjariella thermophila]
MATSELEKRPASTVDIHEEPSAEWGWHGRFPRATQVAGWFSTIVLVLMALVGNHRGHVEVVWLLGIAAVMAVMLIRDLIKRRRTFLR